MVCGRIVRKCLCLKGRVRSRPRFGEAAGLLQGLAQQELDVAIGAAEFIVRPLLHAAPPGFFLWLLAGGVIYTVGAIFHATKWPRARQDGTPRVFGSHEIWHLCVMGGSFAHYWAMLAYVSRAV